MVVFIGLCRVLFRSAFTYDPERLAALMALDEREVIRDRPLLIRSGIVLVLVMAGFIAHSALHIEPSLVALLGAGALVALSKLDPPEFLEEVEWPTLVFFMGLFVMVVEIGVIGRLGEVVTEAVGDRCLLASSALLWGSGLLSAIIDNIPYVATMARRCRPWSTPAAAPPRRTPCGGRWPWAPTSAATPPPWEPRERRRLGIAARNGHPISFRHFNQVRLDRRRGHDRDQLGLPLPAVLRRRVRSPTMRTCRSALMRSSPSGPALSSDVS